MHTQLSISILKSYKTFTMKQLWLLIGLFLICFVACKQDGVEKVSNDSEESVRSVKPISSKVRSELTADKPLDESKIAKIEFESTSHNFGEVKEGTVVKHTFKFKNTGKVPLTIKEANASCGCTVPSYTEAPVAPGDEGEITLKFNSDGRPGDAEKSVTIIANTYPQTSKVSIKGKVIAKTVED